MEEARKARKAWHSKINLDTQTLKKLSKAKVSPKEIKSESQAEEIAGVWELGNIIHDMRIASDQSITCHKLH